jgi:hypothetical protein
MTLQMYYFFMTNILFYNTFVRFYNYQGEGAIDSKEVKGEMSKGSMVFVRPRLLSYQSLLSYKFLQLYYCSLSDFCKCTIIL